jgi:hypothetical protein
MRRLLLLPLLLVSQMGSAQQPAPTLSQKLFKFVASTQIREHEDNRFVGLWLNRVQATGDMRSFPETDLFTGLHTMLMLYDVDQITPLDGFDEIRALFNIPFELYRKDSKDKSGTLNFWPLRASGVHGFTTDPDVLAVTGIPDLPNDFDDSSLGFLWQIAEGQNPNSDLIDALGKFHDASSGAFATWYGPKVGNKDCVVNLNILHALASFEKQGKQLPLTTLANKDSAISFIRQILENKKTGHCDLFYNRASQFFVALARVHDTKSDYVPFLELALDELRIHAEAALNSENGTEIAEYLIALKLFRKSNMSFKCASLIDPLATKLVSLIHTTETEAFLSGDSVFYGMSQHGEWAGKEQHWFSSAQSTATALLALTML